MAQRVPASAPLRVLHVSRDLPQVHGGGGVARHIEGLAHWLRGAGVDVTIATSAEIPSRAALPAGWVHATGLPLYRLIRDADVVHVHGGRWVLTAASALLCVILGRPYLFTPHAYYQTPAPLTRDLRRVKWLARSVCRFGWDQFVERLVLGRAYRVILLTRSWIEEIPIHPASMRIEVIPNSVDLGALPVHEGDAPHLAGRPAILTVGRLDEVKCVEDEIAALREPGMEAAVLHLVGLGPDRARLEAITRDLDVTDRVVFHGFVDDARVAEMCAGADVFVLASRQEGLPTVLIESVARGLPTVASDIPGNRAVLGEAGDVLFPPHDVPRLATLVLEAANAGLSEDVRDRVRRAFSWETHAPTILALYANAASR